LTLGRAVELLEVASVGYLAWRAVA